MGRQQPLGHKINVVYGLDGYELSRYSLESTAGGVDKCAAPNKAVTPHLVHAERLFALVGHLPRDAGVEQQVTQVVALTRHNWSRGKAEGKERKKRTPVHGVGWKGSRQRDR